MGAPFPLSRPRRNRINPVIREMLRETDVRPCNLVLPLFLVPGNGVSEPVKSMEGVFRWSCDMVQRPVEEALESGVRSFLLFGIPSYKDDTGSSADDPSEPVQRALEDMRSRYPEAYLVSDVCLCEYTSHGHCGVIRDGVIHNDGTLERLASVALSHARAGAHAVAPSDMMDGRIIAVRKALESHGFPDVAIWSYAAKFASAFYGPFREAAQSAPSFGDRKSHQLPHFNRLEALRDALMDEDEGADLLIVKPAGTSLDVIRDLKDRTMLPIGGYVVSGEHCMLKDAIGAGHMDKSAYLEYHQCVRRAGCSVIITYGATELAREISVQGG
ncbi:delta-aminolevulinic acid dehydratase [Thermanaerovibrio velox DSM 12556]|uniref:Delta-aminolevulinic acid dehydratase n=1 Tax=Thermanaerovibrio velox DSM 12556 TaxID=926567 RepID=H0UMV3_9BACT|nr:porphobilinogen synthase [Thermanaerovibrio velox]EHM09248.1 delta-aminolevulinic acid dehydratase [Thermanaerovibrio velox DSM 12556]